MQKELEKRRKSQELTFRSLNHFNLTFGHFESLLLWKVLFIDDDRLFIKMGNSENIMGKVFQF